MPMPLALLILAAVPEPAAQTVVKQISVDGRSFNVEMKGDRAFVTPHAALRAYAVEGGGLKLGRRAAELASGCRSVTGRATPAGLIVRLDCRGVR